MNSSRIARLPPELVNQIAAGEVVERPSSVIKELVENSLDAGASRIEVLLRDGGLSEITVADNGVGMVPDDLALCAESHTTSKLQTSRDLEAILTFGFRGEALASIASVAEMEIISRTAEMPSAFRIQISQGKCGELRPVGAPIGTRLTVKGLFSKIPARLKFMRSPATELSHCVRLFRELALGAPDVNFYLHHQGKLLQKYVGQGKAARFAECLKQDWHPLIIEAEADGLSLAAYLSPLDLPADRGEVFLFINGRAVRNRTLVAAIRRAYEELLGPHHEPSGVVYLTITPSWVDVNVHPQKWEVRLLGQERLFSWLIASVRKALSQQLPPTFATPVLSENKTTYSRVRPLGYLRPNYLLCMDGEDLVVIDERAWNEVSVTGKLRSGDVALRRLEVPKVVHLPPELGRVYEAHRERVSELGIEAELYGGGDLALVALPDSLDESRTEDLVQDLLRKLAGGEVSSEELQATIGRHSVIVRENLMAELERIAESSRIGDADFAVRIPFARIVKEFDKYE